MVTRLKATESPFTGRYASGHFHGTFVCACCEAELFSSQAKFESGTGWPSFWQPVKVQAIDRAIDNSDGEPRIEVMCHRCGAHLGHVFDDGPPPTGLRFCINSLSLKLKRPDGQIAKPAATKTKSRAKTTRTRSPGTADVPDQGEGEDDRTRCARAERREAGRGAGPGQGQGRRDLKMTSGGDWLLLQELLERGDPEFVDRLRSVTRRRRPGPVRRALVRQSVAERPPPAARLPRTAAQRLSPRGARQAAVQAGRGRRRRCRHGAVPGRVRSVDPASAAGTAPERDAAGREPGGRRKSRRAVGIPGIRVVLGLGA